jgi:hypothetical protein
MCKPPTPWLQRITLINAYLRVVFQGYIQYLLTAAYDATTPTSGGQTISVQYALRHGAMPTGLLEAPAR